MNTPRIILASTSRYRVQLLQRLLPEFEQIAHGVDEAERMYESPQARADRLAEAKARAVAQDETQALVIGSDQVAELGGRLLEKPGDISTAHAQLAACSTRRVYFHTAICVVDTRSSPARIHTHRDLTQVHFRELDAEEIERYIEREEPLDCAGSFKCEGLGISLFERIVSEDPTALVGLPLIALSNILRTCDVPVP